MLTLSFESMNFEKHRLSCKMEPRVKLKMQMVHHLVFEPTNLIFPSPPFLILSKCIIIGR